MSQERVLSKKNTSIFRFVFWFFLANSLTFCLLGFNYLKSILLSPTLLNNNAVSFSTCFEKTFIYFFTVINYLSFMIFLAFIPGIVVYIFSRIIPNKRLIWIVSVLLAAISTLLLIIDNNVYTMFKFHLNSTMFGLIFSGEWRGVFDFSTIELLEISSVISLIVVLECAIAYFVWNKIIKTNRYLMGKFITACWLGGALFSSFTLLLSISAQKNLFSQQLPALPLLNQLITYSLPNTQSKDTLLQYSEQYFAQPMYSNEQLYYPQHAMQCTKPKIPYNIILIAVDSLRFDSLHKQLMPNVTKFAAKNWQFTNYYSGGNSTQAGLFSLFYSIPVNYWTAAIKQAKPSVLMSLLHDYDYAMRILWASQLTTPPFDKSIFMGIANADLFGGSEAHTGDSDRLITKYAIDFLTPAHEKPFFLHLFYQAAHAYCHEQSYPIIYKPIQEKCSRLLALNNDTDPQPYYNRYLNAVSFIDSEIAQLLDVIEKRGYLKNSVIIFTADHGQEFNDNKQNYWDHASNYTDIQTHVPLIIHWPEESPQQFNYVTSSYDMVPTLLQRLFACQNPVSDYSIGQNLLQETDRLPFVLAGSYVTMGIISPEQLTTLYTSGMIAVTDKHAMPLPKAQPDVTNIKQVYGLMRRYFHSATPPSLRGA